MILDYKAIGVRIKDARSMQDMSQERLAELAGLSTTHTSHKAVFEGELARTVSDCDEMEIRVIADMAKALKTSMRRRLED